MVQNHATATIVITLDWKTRNKQYLANDSATRVNCKTKYHNYLKRRLNSVRYYRTILSNIRIEKYIIINNGGLKSRGFIDFKIE
jgi:hypothetical protein